MLITEIIPDTSGGWRERKASLALVDENAHKGKTKK
jgi:Tfp pilus assembly protein PilP